jgi:arsenite methyltransferase
MTGTGTDVDEQTTIRERVRHTYAAAAGNVAGVDAHPLAGELYGGEDLPAGGAIAASLGCANPNVLVELRPGQTVLDLGSGGGLDVLISARRVAPGGRAIGVDMTPEMLELARRNAAEAGVSNVEFRRGTIEDLPVGDGEIDVVISNCVVNLSPDKDRVLAEAFRVLVPGGRLAIADLATLAPLPPPLADSLAAWAGCIAGALTLDGYQRALAGAGFVDARVRVHRRFGPDDLALLDGTPLERLTDAGIDESMLRAADGCVAGVFVTATKPAPAG